MPDYPGTVSSTTQGSRAVGILWISVWVTVAPLHIVIPRVTARSGMSEAEILDRVNAQLPAGELSAIADVVIDTDCSFPELKERVRAAWDALIARL